MCQSTAVPTVAKREVLVSRNVSHVCSSSIAANCQRNHWPTHKQECKGRAAELRDEALFKDPPPKEDCPICFLPMPTKIISCVSLPPATITSVPIHDCAEANEEMANMSMETYLSCCGFHL